MNINGPEPADAPLRAELVEPPKKAARSRFLRAIILIAAIGFIGIGAIAIWQAIESSRLRRPLVDWVDEQFELSQVDVSLLTDAGIAIGEEQDIVQPEGYRRGRCLLVDFDPSTGNAKLHSWHEPAMQWRTPVWGILAKSPEEVETVCLVYERHVLAGSYENVLGPVAKAFDHVVTTTVIDWRTRRVVRQFSTRGKAPQQSVRNQDMEGF